MDDVQAPSVPGYAVGRLLGQGGSASVWLATEKLTDRDYALKCFRPPSRGVRAGEGLTEDAVKREIRILSVLDHQHLVKAHDAVPVEGVPGAGTALVMDYASGGSLAQLVASRGSLSVGETVTVVTPIAQALGYLHANGFTHSDVSPGNVLFTGQGKPLLSDVGIARMLGDPGRAGSPGTPGFVDPAPVDAVRAGLQPERDVYSAAALGWYCLTGEAPARTADRPPLSLLVPGVPRELAAALESGLNEDRRLRPTASALATAVYRSASPRPLDLAAAVHPTVIPELLTRRHVPPSSSPNRIKEQFEGVRRRVVTSPWTGKGTRSHRLPFPDTRQPAAGRGKHAGRLRDAPPIRRWMLRAALPAVAVLAVAGGWSVAGGSSVFPPGDAAPGATADPGSPAKSQHLGDAVDPAGAARQQAAAADPAQALVGLAALRDHAFSRGNLDLLGEVNADGSPAAAADSRTAGRLRSSGLVLAGFATSLSGVATENGATDAHAVVRATSATSAYQEQDAQGSVLAAGEASTGEPLRLVLVSVDGAWRISEILPGS
ncbi:serine/threonine-protein kinase [Arthrobacter sp. P2b]|uniref:serine/threonine-protein kinase n=1 Tax=Arthrobacter sp. P2b TaxID=1938741 RepID=UPI0009A5B0AB|nr:serine/threonine-protein kinase [Arthrobacter sp. P2b]SLK05103.1 Serine/threonine protein kinase [Arthrobacter sp. P2b]